jgi:hypothetical protein
MEETIGFYELAEALAQAFAGTPEGCVLQYLAKRPRIRVKQSRVFWRPARVRFNESDRGEGVSE